MTNSQLPAIIGTLIPNRQGYDLEQVVDWIEKFHRHKEGRDPPFSPQELVKVKGFLEYDEDGLRIHVDSDGRVADNFYLSNVLNPRRAKKYGGLPFESILRIIGFRQQNFQISDIQNYDAELLDVTSLPLINPHPQEIARSENTQAVVYGEFIEFKRIGSEKTSENDATVRTEDGRVLEVHLPTGKIVFSDGSLENICGKMPEEGDLIRISTKIFRGRLFAHWCDPCYLVKPSKARFAEAEQLRLMLDRDLNQTMKHMELGKYADARRILADIRSKEATNEQLDRTYEIAKQMPQEEQPVMTSKGEFINTREKNYLVKSIDQAYDTRLESLTSEEFISFAKGALSGKIPETREHTDVTYLLRVAPLLGFDALCIESLAAHAIQGRLERMKGKQQPEFTDTYVLEQSIITVFHQQTPNMENIITDTVRQLQAAKIELPFQVAECYSKLPCTQKLTIENNNL